MSIRKILKEIADKANVEIKYKDVQMEKDNEGNLTLDGLDYDLSGNSDLDALDWQTDNNGSWCEVQVQYTEDGDILDLMEIGTGIHIFIPEAIYWRLGQKLSNEG